MTAWRFALSGLRRGWKSPELLILAIAIAVAVAASSAVTLFSDRVARAIANQSGETFGADASFLSRTPLSEELVGALERIGVRRTALVQFPSMASAGERTSLVSVKAAGDGYPLRGTLRSSSEPFAVEREDAAGPGAGEAWVDLRGWQDLGLNVGTAIQLGRSTFKVTRLLTYEPDRGGGFGDLAPRVLVALSDLDATGLLGPGSRVSWSTLVAGDERQLQEVTALPLPTGVRRVTPQDGRPEIRNSLSRAQQFLDIAVLAAMLLAGAAIAVTSHQHGVKLRDEAALLKVLGAPMRLIATRSLVRLLALTLVASGVGLVVGVLGQAVVGRIAADLMETPLPPARG
ncbi:MAG TPA: hypothetical protein VJM11_04220, partial [Nevskiaceae bacterium]|nr:hypothetical protein [Nevskiaceae bacterium]